MSYFWKDGIPIKVEADPFGRPLEFTWSGKKHTVSKITNRWIVDDNWWVKRIWRDYYQVITDTRSLLILFRDVETSVWYIQRLYD
jgi:hypothetical protein